MGAFLHDLITDFSWVARRIETVKILDSMQWEHRVSLDIDFSRLSFRIEKYGLQNCPYLPVPLGVFVKELFIDFDVEESGQSLRLLTSSEDSVLTTCALLSLIALKNREDDITTGFDDISEAAQERIYSIIESNELESALEAAAAPFSTEDDERAWHALFDEEEFSEWIVHLCRNYIPMVLIETHRTKPACIIKYRMVRPAGFRPKADNDKKLEKLPWKVRLFNIWYQATGFRGVDVYYEKPSLGFAQRDHLRICAPEGLEIAGKPRIMTENNCSLCEETCTCFSGRVTTERSVIYARLKDATIFKRYFIHQEMRPKTDQFFSRAWLSLLLSLVILCLMSAWIHIRDLGVLVLSFDYMRTILMPFRLQQVYDMLTPILSLLPMLPSLYSIHLSRPAEHPLLSEVLEMPRKMVSTIAVATILLLLWLALPYSSLRIAWVVLAVVTLLVFSAIWTWIIKGRIDRKSILEDHHSTIWLPVKVVKDEVSESVDVD